jgi:FkbM family methyltransferase
MLGILTRLAKAPQRFQENARTAVARMAQLPLSRSIVAQREKYVLSKDLARTTIPGPNGRAFGYLFKTHEPEQSAKDIYRDVFSPLRYTQGYQSQMGQDMYLNRWYFHDQGPGTFIDVGAFDGFLGSNTSYFEKHLQWTGVAFEPNPSAFEVLRTTRSCLAIQGCAYDRDGEVPFLALSEKQHRHDGEQPPRSLLSMVLAPSHGGTMLSGIPEHMDQVQRTEWARVSMDLSQTVSTVACHRIDTVLNGLGVKIVDYLSIDVEGAELEVLRGIDFGTVQVNVISVEHSERFQEVYELLTTAGFEYQGLLFFDEIFVHTNPRYSWDVRAIATPDGNQDTHA